MLIGELREIIDESSKSIADIDKCQIDIVDIPFFGKIVRITEPSGEIHTIEI